MVPAHENLIPPLSGLEKAGVLDAFAHDKRDDKLVLAMFETRPWLGEDSQLFQLQEKLNAYLSFLLDGEMADSFPQYAGKPVHIQLRTVFEPDPRALQFLADAAQQLTLQQISLEVIQISEGGACECGNGGCGS